MRTTWPLPRISSFYDHAGYAVLRGMLAYDVWVMTESESAWLAGWLVLAVSCRVVSCVLWRGGVDGEGGRGGR